MKKNIFLMGVLVLSLLLLSSCNRTYYAYVTIFNDGEILITASVDDDVSLINAGEGVEWTLSWQDTRSIVVYLYAEPVGYNDYDEAWVTLRNGDEYEWETGWVLVSAGAKKKNKE